MKDRIKQIMQNERLTSSAFADKLQLGRAVVSHILNGRNNPSLEVVTRILSQWDNINPDWLLTGTGNMYKNDPQATADILSQPIQQNGNGSLFQENQPDLFSHSAIIPDNNPQTNEYRKEIVVEQPKKEPENIENKTIIYQKPSERKITKIIIYYSDNTFETFDANIKPL